MSKQHSLSWQSILQSVARVLRLARKELWEILSDRRTILTLVLMPLLLYPLLSFAFRQFLLAYLPRPDADRPYRIGVQDFKQKRQVERFLALSAEVEFERVAGIIGLETPSTTGGPLLAGTLLYAGRAANEPLGFMSRFDPIKIGAKPRPAIIVEVRNYIIDDLIRRDIDAAVDVTYAPGVQPSKSAPQPKHGEDNPVGLDWKITYLVHFSRSRELVAYLEHQNTLANARVVQAALDRHHVHQTAMPVRILRNAIESDEPISTISLTALVPLILILMTITGAVYPAIDLTAGERERGTLEILVAAPVPRMSLLFAKYIAVVVVAMMTATINLAMMLVTLQLNNMTGQVFKQSGVTVELVVELFFLLLLFAAFFSAVLLALTSFARSFKEAQAYLVPLMLVSLAPGVLGMIPGLELKGILAVTPLVNIVLLARDLSEGTATTAVGLIVVSSTLVYAAAAITVAARIFGAEAVLFSEQSSWSDMFRRPEETRKTATVSAALLCLALFLPAIFLVGGLVARAPRDSQLAYELVGTGLLFAVVPLLACLLGRINLQSGLQLTKPPAITFVAALLLAVGAVPAIFQVGMWLREAGLIFLTNEMEQHARALIQSWLRNNIAFVAGALALMGMAEELFFRGYLFSALRAQTGQRLTIVVSAVLFGLFHCVVQFDKLIPSTLMGLLLGWVCWQTRSVLPGMVLHAAFNALLVLIMYLNAGRHGAVELQQLPLWWQIAALPAMAAGAGLVWRFRAHEKVGP
ncbi:MAG TPA: ABC transporter permease subunit/CPBP intramembrane protease [Gemmataceae bacterium]|nr:ABC transporter permease subunit/CPBP intramembrane protease [Gemmataceae bacterium]